MTRSILLMHYPAEMYPRRYLRGYEMYHTWVHRAKNDSNDKGTHVSAVKMRASCGLHNDG